MTRHSESPEFKCLAARDHALRGAVHRALRLSAGVMAIGATLGFVPDARAGLFPAEFELSSLLPANGGDGSTGVVLLGIDDGDNSGSSVSAAGDVNGDGLDDLIIGAPDAEPYPLFHGGESYVVFGRDTAQNPSPPVAPLSGLLLANGGDGSLGFVLNGFYRDDDLRAGSAVSAAGDINGDGIDDVIIGSSCHDCYFFPFDAETYVVFGRDTAQAGSYPAELPLEQLYAHNGGDGSAGFVLHGSVGTHAGSPVSAAGDINGDGIDDLIIGDPATCDFCGDPGSSFVVFGRDTAQVGNFPAELDLFHLADDGSEGFELRGIEVYDGLGYTVSAAGDVNADGIDDLITGAAYGGQSYYGQTYVVFGRDTAQTGNFPVEFELSSLLSANGGDGSAGFVLNSFYGITFWAGLFVSDAGDVNGDGVDDVMIGAPAGDPGGRNSAGQTYVVFGHDTDQTGDFPAEIELSSLLLANGGDGSGGFVLNGINDYDLSGVSVSAAGDVNGDGLDDLIIGASSTAPGHYGHPGESYVVFGRDTARAGNFPAEIELSSLLPANGGDGGTGVVLKGIDGYDHSGRSVSAAGDVNGDGVDDLIIGAPAANPGARISAGESYVIFGRKDTDGDDIADALDNCTLLANADQRDTNGDGYGNLCDPDLNNDGIVNFSDLGLFKPLFFSADADADFNGDGGVNFGDLGTIKTFFFQPPGPSGLVQ